MIETIVTGVITLASKLAELVGRTKKKPVIEKPLTKLESERIVEKMMAQAKAMAEAEKARKKAAAEKKP
jgi:hypothetical protein